MLFNFTYILQVSKKEYLVSKKFQIKCELNVKNSLFKILSLVINLSAYFSLCFIHLKRRSDNLLQNVRPI